MRRRGGAVAIGFELALGCRELDPGDFLARGEIDHGKAVDVGQLHEDPLGRAVGARLDRHRANALVELDLPRQLFRRQIDDADRAGADRPGDGVFAVGGHIDIVQPAVDRNAFGPRQGCGIDDVERARIAGNADHDAAVPGDRDIVGMRAQRHLLDQFAGLAVEHVQRRIDLVADIDPGTVGRERDAVRALDSLDLLDHLVGRGIDHMDAVAGAVGDVDAGGAGPGRNRCKDQQQPHMTQDAEGLHGRRAPVLILPQGTQPFVKRQGGDASKRLSQQIFIPASGVCGIPSPLRADPGR